MTKIFSHLSPEYINYCKKHGVTRNNGAYWYSKELYENIIPHIKTRRNWVLVNIKDQCYDNSIVFIHNNKNPERYWWLCTYRNLILVCSQYKTLRFISELFPYFHCIYSPLSIDVSYVSQFKVKRKTKDVAYFGRFEKCPKKILEDNKIDKIYGESRTKLLKELAEYKTVYAIGRCAIEAKCLGCNVINHKGEWENTEFKLRDNSEVIPELQRLLNEIDGVK